MDREQFQKAYAKIVAQAWADDAFKQRLLSDPTTVLKENGIDIPAGLEIKVLESTSTLVHLVLPPRPDPARIGTADLDARLAAGHVGCPWL